MRHVLGKDDGEFHQAGRGGFIIILVLRRLINQFLFPLLRNRINVRDVVLDHVANHLPGFGVMALLEVAATGVTIDLDGAVVLINHVAVTITDGHGDVNSFEKIHSLLILRAAKVIFFIFALIPEL